MTKIGGINNFFQKAADNPTLYFAASIVAKDIIGCVMYTSTARANKQYTPERRSDVANYDLANGIINVGMQLLLIKPIDKLINKFAESKIVKNFFNDMDGQLNSSNKEVALNAIKRKSRYVKGSAAIISMIITQYVIKRFIAPYLSMPAGVKLAERGVVKPKLYPGETYDKNNRKEKVK